MTEPGDNVHSDILFVKNKSLRNSYMLVLHCLLIGDSKLMCDSLLAECSSQLHPYSLGRHTQQVKGVL